MVDAFDTDPETGAPTNSVPVSPIRSRLSAAYVSLIERSAQLTAAMARVPEKITDDETQGKVSTLVGQIVTVLQLAEEIRVKEKAPYWEAGREVDVFFTEISRPILEAKTKLQIRGGQYLREKREVEAAILGLAATPAAPAEATRVRADSGALSTLKEGWSIKKIDVAKVDFKALRPYITADMIETAVKKWMKTNAEGLDDESAALKGVTFEKTAKAGYRR